MLTWVSALDKCVTLHKLRKLLSMFIILVVYTRVLFAKPSRLRSPSTFRSSPVCFASYNSGASASRSTQQPITLTCLWMFVCGLVSRHQIFKACSYLSFQSRMVFLEKSTLISCRNVSQRLQGHLETDAFVHFHRRRAKHNRPTAGSGDWTWECGKIRIFSNWKRCVSAARDVLGSYVGLYERFIPCVAGSIIYYQLRQFTLRQEVGSTCPCVSTNPLVISWLCLQMDYLKPNHRLWIPC